MPYRRRHSTRNNPPYFLISMFFFAIAGGLLWLFLSQSGSYEIHNSEDREVISAQDWRQETAATNSPVPAVAKRNLPSHANVLEMVSEWRKIHGGNLQDEGTASDMAEWLDALTNRGAAYQNLKKHAPLFGPWRAKMDLMKRYLGGLIDESIVAEL